MMTEDEREVDRQERFFSKPWFVAVSAAANLIMIPLSFYFYSESIRERELTYSVSPVKSIVVKAGEATELAVTHGGDPIESDVTSALLAFWNAGKESIRTQHVLSPLVIRTEPKTPILEARVRKETREVVELELDRSRMDQGEVDVSWFILEEDDGGIVQLVFSGGTEVDIYATAEIEGQQWASSVDRAENSNVLELFEQFGRRTLLFLVVSLALVTTLLVDYFVLNKHREHERSPWLRLIVTPWSLGLFCLLFLLIVLLLLFPLLKSLPAVPPFGL